MGNLIQVQCWGTQRPQLFWGWQNSLSTQHKGGKRGASTLGKGILEEINIYRGVLSGARPG